MRKFRMIAVGLACAAVSLMMGADARADVPEVAARALKECDRALCFSVKSNDLAPDLRELPLKGCALNVPALEARYRAPQMFSSDLRADDYCWKGAFAFLSRTPEPRDPVEGKERYRLGLVQAMCGAIPVDAEEGFWDGGLVAREACYQQAIDPLSDRWNTAVGFRGPFVKLLKESCHGNQSQRVSRAACFEGGLAYLLKDWSIPAGRHASRRHAFGLLLSSCAYPLADETTDAWTARAWCFERGGSLLPEDFNLRAVLRGCASLAHDSNAGMAASQCFQNAYAFLVAYDEPRDEERKLLYTTGLLLTAMTKEPAFLEPGDRRQAWKEAIARKIVSAIESPASLRALLRQPGADEGPAAVQELDRYLERYMPLYNIAHTCANSSATPNCYSDSVYELWKLEQNRADAR